MKEHPEMRIILFVMTVFVALMWALLAIRSTEFVHLQLDYVFVLITGPILVAASFIYLLKTREQ